MIRVITTTDNQQETLVLLLVLLLVMLTLLPIYVYMYICKMILYLPLMEEHAWTVIDGLNLGISP
jgi:hypothetical protein